MNAFGKNRGAVSVFLVIILVPCMLVSSLFVDAGRVSLSRNLAESSAELALNTLLTHYDAELTEWYGMAASCQTIDEFYAESADFFVRMLKSQDLSGDEISLLADSYASLTEDGSVYDLLQMECKTENNMITAVTDADLSNSSIIKTQIVEFMKYRAPIIAVTGLIDKLKSDGSGAKDLEEHSENEELVESKTDFYEAEGELIQAAFNTYVALFDYTSLGADNEKLQNDLDSLVKFRAIYRESHELMIKNLYNTDGLPVFLRPTADFDSSAYDYKDTSISRKEEVSVPSAETDEASSTEVHYYADGNRINSFRNEMSEAVSRFKTAVNDVVSAGGGIGYINGDTYDIQYWVRLHQSINQPGGGISRVAAAAEDMLDAYAKLDALTQCEAGNGAPSNWIDVIREDQAEVEKLQRSCLTAGHTYSGEAVDGIDLQGYLELVSRLESISAANIDNINPGRATISDGRTIGAAVSDVSQKLRDMSNTLQEYLDALNKVIDGDESEGTVSLDELKKLAAKYSTSLTTWTNTANGTDTDMGKKDRDIINGNAENEKDNLSQYCKEINEAAVNELLTRLVNMRSQIQTVLDAVNSLTYGGDMLTDIGSYDSFHNNASAAVDAGRIGLTYTQLQQYASETFQQLFSPEALSDNPLAALNAADQYNVLLDPRSGEVKVPKLYLYLHGQFNGCDKREVDEKKNQMKKAQSEAENKKKSALERKADKDAAEIPRSFSPDGKKFGLGSALLSSLTNLVGNLINGDLQELRDNLYVGTYMMEMFSYATYENEGLYSLVENKESLNSVNYQERYEAVRGTPERENTWLSKSLKDSYNKSLTNKLINGDNNAAYLCEIEYILYGESNDKNIKSAYSDIYAIRYALNLVSAFQHFWGTGTNTGTVINTIANSIAAATYGIIPAALVKVVLLPILTIFETSMDLDRLEKGFPVELYKKAEDWVISLEAGTELADITGKLDEQDDNGSNKDKGLQYSDYMTLFIHLGLQGDESKSEAMYLRMAEVMQENMRRITADEDYDMKKAKVFFSLNADIETAPLMIKLPIFRQDYDGQLDGQTEWCTFHISTTRGYP